MMTVLSVLVAAAFITGIVAYKMGHRSGVAEGRRRHKEDIYDYMYGGKRKDRV